MGIGISFFTETVGAGPRKHMDILGLGMADGAELRVHPTGKARRAAVGADPGPGPRDDVRPDRRRGARHPAGGHRGRPRRHRQHPVRAGHLRHAGRRRCRGAAAALVARKVRDKARLIAAAMLEARPTTSSGRSAAGTSRATRTAARRSRSIAMAAHGTLELPEGVEGHLDAQVRLRPAEPHLPVRRLHLRRRRRPGHRTGQGAALHRRRRLRHPHQPDDRRGPGPRRPRRRHRAWR